MCTDKKSLKQYALTDNDGCTIYLAKIIGTIDVCLTRYKRYNDQLLKIIDDYRDRDQERIPYSIYEEMMDKTSNVMDYLLNIIGDAQQSSISYFKYRKQAEKLIDRGKTDVRLSVLTPELITLLNSFNRLRNWQNHVPESLLTSEVSLIDKEDLRTREKNPIRIVYHNYVALEYLADLLRANNEFYEKARLLHQAVKRDYAILIGESVNIERIYTDECKTIAHLEPARLSAEVQGL